MRLLEIHIEVADLDKSTALYENLLPHVKIVRWPNRDAVAFVLADGTSFGVWKKDKIGLHDARAGEHVHFAFQIQPDEYDEYKQKIEAAGLDVIEHVWPEGHKSLYFFDYDGHQGEFMTTDWLRKS